jgi:hypothetical protein
MKKGEIREEGCSSSQRSELTDISVSTGSIKPSRKRIPSPTLNRFASKSRPTVEELPESYFKEESEIKEGRRTMDFMDKAIYEEADEKVELREKWWEAEGKEEAIKVEKSGKKRESNK